jgi:hypothetical protein
MKRQQLLHRPARIRDSHCHGRYRRLLSTAQTRVGRADVARPVMANLVVSVASTEVAAP